MARTKKSDGRATRQDILDAALELFSEHGFHGTAVRDIAEAVGVREGAIYHHFPSKDLLFDAVLADGLDGMAQDLATLVEAYDIPDVRVALEKLVVDALERFGTLKERKRFRLLLADGLRLARLERLDFLDRAGLPAEPMVALLQRFVVDSRLRREEPDSMFLEFAGPILAWRVTQELAPGFRLVTDRRTFARDHVEHFVKARETVLNARTGRPPVISPVPRKRSSRSRRGSRTSRA